MNANQAMAQTIAENDQRRAKFSDKILSLRHDGLVMLNSKLIRLGDEGSNEFTHDELNFIYTALQIAIIHAVTLEDK